MKPNNVLQKLEAGQLDAEAAYGELYEPSVKESGRRAFFIKMNVSIPEEGKGLNTFLKILFMIPLPLIFVRLAARLMSRKIKQYSDSNMGDANVDINELLKLLKYSKGTVIEVDAEDANVNIKVI